MATVRNLVRLAVRAAEERKARDAKAIDVHGLSSVTDFMIVCTGSSDTNVRAIAENIREQLDGKGVRPLSVEGLREGTWVLLDYVDFVVHVFLAEKRLFYGIEELWADAKPVPLAAPAARKKLPRTAEPEAGPAARPAIKEALPPLRRTALKPAARRTPAPRKAAGSRRTGVPKKAAVPKKKPQA